MEYKGIAYLKKKLSIKQSRVRTRYRYYEMKNVVRDFGISTPPDLRPFFSVLGWCGTAVDSLADRLVFRGFKDDNFDLEEIYQLNNSDILIDSADTSALIASCSFIAISEDENGYPRMEVIEADNATGVLDHITNMLTEGYAVLERNDAGNPVKEAYYTVEYTAYYEKGELVDYVDNPAPYALLVPIINRPDAKRPFGHSRISRACMSVMESVIRTMKRSEISAEFYSFPQKYILGMSDADSEALEKWKASMSSLLDIGRDEDGNLPSVGQFSQQSMSPHMEQLKMFAAIFAGETGLTLDDLGIVSDNPSSSEAIKATHENLRLKARKAQRDFGVGLINAGFLAACVRDNWEYQRQQIYLTKPVWEPVFETDFSSLGVVGDGINKINQAIPGYFNADNVSELTGIRESNIEAPAVQGTGGAF